MSTIIMSKCWPLQMGAAPKAILMSLADNANDEGVCWPSIETIAMRTCYSERTVSRAISQLEKDGWLIVHEREGRSNVYKLRPDNIPKQKTTEESKSSKKDHKGVTECQGCQNVRGDRVSGGGCHSVMGGVTECQEGDDRVSPRTVIDPSLNRNDPSFGENTKKSNKPKESKKATSLPKDFKPNENHIELSNRLGVDLQNELEKFCDYVKANGKTYKDWSAAFNNWIRNSTRFWTGNKQPQRTREITPATNEIPPGFLNSRPDYESPQITQEDLDAAPY